jgi:predicted O-linked N-acetylglucosamine transferase (SPINDLY family)
MIREDYGKWLARGRKHQEAGRPIDAMLCYRRALKSNQYAAQAQYRLGEVLRDLGRDDEALAAWRTGLFLAPGHERLLLSLGSAARRAGAHGDAINAYQRLLAAEPDHRRARLGIAFARIGQGDEAACRDLDALLREADEFGHWEELARVVAAAAPSAPRTALLADLALERGDVLPPLLLACAAQALISVDRQDRARALVVRAGAMAAEIEDEETLRQLALAGAMLGGHNVWAERYALHCAERFGSRTSLLWPRRSAGEALRVAYLISAAPYIQLEGRTVPLEAYLRMVIAAHPRERVAAAVYVVADQPPPGIDALASACVPVAMIGARPAATVARAIAEADSDALVDLVGLRAPLGPLLAQAVARTQWTYKGLVAANMAPLVTGALTLPDADGDEALGKHRIALEAALRAGGAQPGLAASSERSAAELAAMWRAALSAQEASDADAAIAGYRKLLAEQADYAPALHLLGILLRNRGQREEAARSLAAAVAAAPRYAEARAALANLYRESCDPERAVKLAKEGLALEPKEVSLLRSLGLAQLALHHPRPARDAFKRALALAPGDAETHYNEGVALQMLRRRAAALKAYQRALALNPELVAADFNIGVVFREQGRRRTAAKAFERVLERDPHHAGAHKALAETRLEGGRVDAWLKTFDRFEAACPDALPLVSVALEACQYRGDFAAVDRYLERLAAGEFKAANDTELVDSLEEILFLLLYFDFDSEAQYLLYKTYDAAARRVYGASVRLARERRPGRIRVGYLSGDLRNHVMGKMMWPAIERHDNERFELYFYSLSAASDEWTERYRGLPGHFEVIAELSEQEAAARIAEDDIDILVDLSTNTAGAKPGILALKPARVQLTHVASAGVLGLSTVDFKLTDALADVPETQQTQFEAFLAMEGCVYPYRRIEPAAQHPFHRSELGLAPDAVVIGAFVNPLKLSRRCLALWREILVRVPRAVLAVSPRSHERRISFGRLLSAAGIPHARVCVVPQGRDDAEAQARYNVVDFVLDPMPYGGANGTLEPLDMGVPVVTLVGRRHGERCAYSILSNLGVRQTIAASGREYVEIAERLATDKGFMAEVRAAIRRGLKHSALTDMDAHTRHLESAYLRALEQRFPGALLAPRDG